MKSSTIQDWKPARQYPDTYPGDCPDHSYVILNDRVHPLAFAAPGDLSTAIVLVDGRRVLLDSILSERGLPVLADRYPSLAYGANRNPGTLTIKMHNYGYRGGCEEGIVLPVLKGTTRGEDVVACGLSSQGYLYADLLPTIDGKDETVIEAWLPLLDLDQLHVMHDGEDVRSGLYTVAQFPFRLEGFAREFPALGYAGNDHAFVSPILDKSLAYTAIRVSDRVLPEMTPVQMMDHLLEVGCLASKMSKLVAVSKGESLAIDLMRFMNERWWIRFRGEDQPDSRYDEIIAELTSVIGSNRSLRCTGAVMKERGLTFSVDEAYHPRPEQRLGAVLS